MAFDRPVAPGASRPAAAPGRPTRTAALPSASADVVIVGAGVVGAACAYYAARSGLRVTVVDRGGLAGGSTGQGEGNLLVSDKNPGPELDLAVRSLALWRELGTGLGTDDIELDAKGGLVVAASPAGLAELGEVATRQRAAGLDVVDLGPDGLAEHEPYLAAGLAGGAYYPQDMQVQPMLAAAALVRAAVRDHGATFLPGTAATSIHRSPRDGRVVAAGTSGGRIATPVVVNAAGVWAAEVARLADVELPVTPRRGFILVTEPVPPIVRHKVYAAEYAAGVASDETGLQTCAVVEGTRSGTILIGASRERVGFEATVALPVLARLAAQAVALLPVLAYVHAIRAYRGFRPYSPDHLPVIGPDPVVPGLVHACGHEGAGIGLAPATGDLVTAHLTGAAPPVDPEPFRPGRFAEAG